MLCLYIYIYIFFYFFLWLYILNIKAHNVFYDILIGIWAKNIYTNTPMYRQDEFVVQLVLHALYKSYLSIIILKEDISPTLKWIIVFAKLI